MQNRKLIFFSLVMLLGWSAFAQESALVESQLKDAVRAAESKLGTLEPWQKALFNSEVIPQFQKFIKNYRASGTGVVVDVDQEGIKSYLAFNGQQTLKKIDPKVAVLLAADKECQTCLESVLPIHKMIQVRLENRKLNPLWLNPDEFGSTLNEKILFEEIKNSAKTKNVSGIFLVTLKPVTPEEDDTAHADDRRFIIHNLLSIGEIPLLSKNKEFLDNETFENIELSLMVDLFTDLGTRLSFNQKKEDSPAETWIEISGVKDFSHYNRLKGVLQSQLKSVTSLEERVFSKGKVVFAVRTSLSLNELNAQLEGLKLESGGTSPLVVKVKQQ